MNGPLDSNADSSHRARSVVAAALAREARILAEGIPDMEVREEAFNRVAQALACAGEVEKARDVVEQIQDVGSRNRALVEMAQALGRTGKLREARAAAERIPTLGDRASALVDIVGWFIDANRVSEAQSMIGETLEIAGHMADVETRDAILRRSAVALAGIGKPEEALAAVRRTENGARRVETLRMIFQALYFQGDVESARAVVREVQTLAESMNEGWEKAEAFRETAELLAWIGEGADARVVADDIPDEGKQIEAWGEAAWSFAMKGKISEAREIVERAEDPGDRAHILLKIATALAEEGMASEAEAVIREARGLARRVPKTAGRYSLLAQVAGVLAKAGRLKQALQEAKNIRDVEWHDLALLHISDALNGQRRVQSALEVVDLIKDWSRLGEECLLGMAWSLAEAGNHSQAKAVIRKAYEVARRRDARTRDSALIDVAVTFAAIGSTEEAIAVVREIQEEATRVRGLADVVMCISKVG